MKIVIDSNILFSALIKNSTTRTIILMHEEKFLFPDYIFQELEKHKQLIFKKSELPEKEFNALMQEILSKVTVIPNITCSSFKDKATQLVKDIDEEDVQFVAGTLANPGSILWSDDKKLKQIKEITVLNTAEIISLLYGNK